MNETNSGRLKRNNNVIVEDLEKLSKEELINKILKLEAHNVQLKNIISKNAFKKTTDTRQQKRFNFDSANTRHILLRFYYLGWDYHGFVIQEDTINTIEYYLFEALIKTCLIKDRQSSNYHRCGRTDKGVSSYGQVISLDVRSNLSKSDQHNIDRELNYCKILNKVLPDTIQCISWCPIDDSYSARFNCKSRTYKYFFPKAELNIDIMKTSLQYLIGTHDFRNFCKMDVENGVVTFIRKIIEASIELVQSSSKNCGYDMYALTIKGKAFLWHQIRYIVSILFLVGENKEQPEIIEELLDVEKNPRKPDYNIASHVPLNLFYCDYEDIEEKIWIFNASALSHVIFELQKLWTFSTTKTTMMKTMLDDLEEIYNKQNFNEKLIGNHLTTCLIQGVTMKSYKPLMLRKKCNSLEDKVQQAVKKKKIVNNEDMKFETQE